jgi:hypothetical protein
MIPNDTKPVGAALKFLYQCISMILSNLAPLVGSPKKAGVGGSIPSLATV